MPPKKAAPAEEPPEDAEADAAGDDEQPRKKRSAPVWKIDINNRVTAGELPAGFATSGTIRADYMQVAKALGAVPHPAFKPKHEWDKKSTKKKGGANAEAAAEDAEATGPAEDAQFTVHSIRYDRISSHILGLVLPHQRGPLKVLKFLDARLDVEMLNLLRKGLQGNCSVECLQVEWNPLDKGSLTLQSGRQSGRQSDSHRKTLFNAPKDEAESEEDPSGLALASFMDGDCVLEALAVRACNLGEDQVVPMAAALEKCPWNLRQLNLWENCIDDAAVELIATAIHVYRGLEYLGLGRNMITDYGLEALAKAFSVEVITDEAALKPVQERIKKQQGLFDADVKAKAKAKAKPKAAPGEKKLREAPVYVDELEERPADGEGVAASWIVRRPCELKCLSLSENPIKHVATLEKVQPFGHKKQAELTLVGTPAGAEIIRRYPELTPGQRKAFCFPDRPADAPGPQDGWVLRLM